MTIDAHAKLLVGALLSGAAIVTGDVTLLATASGLGVNWASDALPQLAGSVFVPGSPLAQAGNRALQKALHDLERTYRTTVNPNTERKSFALLRQTSRSVVEPAYPPGAASLADLQLTMATNLEALLHGHNQQEVEFLRRELLAAIAQQFRGELDSDDAAWRAFHGRLIEQLHARAAQPAPPPDFAPVLARIADQQQALDALRDGDTMLAQQLAALHALVENLEKQHGSQVSFHNTGVQAGQNMHQAGGNIYQGSTHVQGGGSASVHNVTGNQTNIHGGTSGPVLSGTFSGPVTFNTGSPSASTPPSVSSDAEQIQDKIVEKKRRLHKLELTAARYGINTPPEVAIEIEDLKRELVGLQREAVAPVVSAQAAPSSSAGQAQPILAIFAEPAQLTATDQREESRILRDVLLPFASQFPLHELTSITPDQLFQALLTMQPQILHFQGHGTTIGLAFEDSHGDRYDVPWQALMDTLATCESLTCVVLNACDSHVHTRVGPQRFHLITTPGSVSTEATRAFTQGFYSALRAGRSIPMAYRVSCNLLGLKGIVKEEWPQLTEAHS